MLLEPSVKSTNSYVKYAQKVSKLNIYKNKPAYPGFTISRLGNRSISVVISASEVKNIHVSIGANRQ